MCVCFKINYSETLISNILSQFFPVTKMVLVFGLYAIPFNASAVGLFSSFLNFDKSKTPSTAPFVGLNTAMASFSQTLVYIFPFIYSSSLMLFILEVPEYTLI